jgi:hypothetical protein
VWWPFRKPAKTDDADLYLRLHRGLAAANKENTKLWKKIKSLEGRIRELEKNLEELAIERDKLMEGEEND